MSEPHVARSEVNLGRARWGALLVGLVLLVVLGLMALAPESRKPVLQSYMWAWVFWAGLTFGCFAVTLLHHTVRGSWGTAVMRIYEAGGGARSLLGMGVLFFPMVAAMLSGTTILYKWADPAAVAADHLLQHKRNFLNPVTIILISVVVFGAWAWLAGFLRRSTLRQDASLDVREEKRRHSWAPAGIVFFVVTSTLAFTGWVMSLDPHWSSTMYGAWFIVGQVLATLSLGTFLVCRNANKLPYADVISPSLTRDLGNMLIAFTLFFSYVSFSQYLIIWSGNIPEYTQYYKTRAEGGWIWVGLSMVILQFVLPFLALLNPTYKRVPKYLMMIAAWIFVVRMIDSYWVVMPAFPNRTTPMPNGVDVMAFVGVGAMWLWLFSSSIREAPLLPVYDQRLKEAAAEAH